MSDVETAIKAVQLYAEMHPRPAQVTQTQAADMLGISRVTMRKYVRCGKIRMNDMGMIPIIEIDRALAPKAA
jgi:response regulator of citrate/malate metabolism